MANCELCGEPMPEGEEMFKFHGYSGNCPKPPLPKPTVEALIEYVHRHDDDGYWLDIRVNREAWALLGPFETETARKRAQDDMLNMMRSGGAMDLPVKPQ